MDGSLSASPGPGRHEAPRSSQRSRRPRLNWGLIGWRLARAGLYLLATGFYAGVVLIFWAIHWNWLFAALLALPFWLAITADTANYFFNLIPVRPGASVSSRVLEALANLAELIRNLMAIGQSLDPPHNDRSSDHDHHSAADHHFPGHF